MLHPHHLDSHNSTWLARVRNWELVTQWSSKCLKTFLHLQPTIIVTILPRHTSYIIFGKVKKFPLKTFQRTKKFVNESSRIVKEIYKSEILQGKSQWNLNKLHIKKEVVNAMKFWWYCKHQTLSCIVVVPLEFIVP